MQREHHTSSDFTIVSAVVRTPCQALINGLTTADLGLPNYDVASIQHSDYVVALQKCGVKNIEVLEKREEFPDSVFVEDAAIALPKSLVITQPGAKSRQGEFTEDMKKAFEKFYKPEEFHLMTGNELLDGGDVMRVGNFYYVGLSSRTNAEGAARLIQILTQEGLDGTPVSLPKGLHLKTIVTSIAPNLLVGIQEINSISEFDNFEKIIVDAEESHGANLLNINGKLLVPLGCPKLLQILEDRGFECYVVDNFEFRKVDGALTCMSVLSKRDLLLE
eukprot:403333729